MYSEPWYLHSVIEKDGYEIRQSSLLYVFVRLFGSDRTQNTDVTDRKTNE